MREDLVAVIEWATNEASRLFEQELEHADENAFYAFWNGLFEVRPSDSDRLDAELAHMVSSVVIQNTLRVLRAASANRDYWDLEAAEMGGGS